VHEGRRLVEALGSDSSEAGAANSLWPAILARAVPVIDCRSLAKRVGSKILLEDVSLTIRRGERVGLVGRNGSGKSTLARLLAGNEEADAGERSARRGAQIEFLAQDPELPGEVPLRELVLGSLAGWMAATARHRELTAAIECSDPSAVDALIVDQARAADEVERLGGWERMHEAEAIIDHLGLGDPERRVGELSGGERRRVALARVLVGEPDLAILDEPTNHLDVDTIEWLEEHLAKRFRGALLLITHDRYFLDRVTTRTLELHAGSLTSYDGGYAAYLEAKATREAHAERVERNRQNFLRRELEWLRRGPKARGTKQKARIARAESALAEGRPEREAQAELRAQSLYAGKQVLSVQALECVRGGRRLFGDLSLDLVPGERIGIIGPNGAGKSSFFACLLGTLEPAEGRIEWGSNTTTGLLDQERSGLDPEATVLASVAGDREVLEIGGEELRTSAYLERFLFDRRAQRNRVEVLSGGERSRVCLAKLLATPVNLLLLDEPTNDLDVETCAALEEMLLEYGGAAFVISHDRWFLDRVATSLLVIDGAGRTDLFRGNYSQYRERRMLEVARERQATEARSAPRQSPGKSAVRDAPRSRKLNHKERLELEGLLERIELAEQAVATIEARLADPSTYRGATSEIAALTAQLEPARAEVEALVARWEELEQRRELG